MINRLMKRNAVPGLLAAAMAVLSVCGCGTDPQSFAGQRIIFPEQGCRWKFFGRDTAGFVRGDRPAILIYYDSRGCTPCRLKELHNWKPVIGRIRRDSLDVDIIPVFNVREDDNDLLIALRSADFDLPILCDADGGLEKRNRIPRAPVYQTFLLDRRDRVVLVGTPVYNPVLLKAYIDKIDEMAHSGR